MFTIDSKTKSFCIKTGEPIADSELVWSVSYIDTFLPQQRTGTTNGTTAVEVVSGLSIFQSPPQNANRRIEEFTLCNKDLVAHNIIVFILDNSIERDKMTIMMNAGYTLHYDNAGWYVTNTTGGRENISVVSLTIGQPVTDGVINEMLIVDSSGNLAQLPSPTLTQLGYLDATSSIQTQFDARLSPALANTKLFIGNGSNVATAQSLSLNATGGAFALGNTGILTMPNADATTRGLLLSADWVTFNAKESVLTFSTGLTRTANTITIDTAVTVDKTTAQTLINKTLTAPVISATTSITDSTNKRFVTDGQLTVIGNTSNTNTGDQSTVSGNAGTATALQTARSIGGVSFNGTADIVPQTIQSVNEATDTTCYVLFITASGAQSLQPRNNAGLVYNSNTNSLTATTFSGALTGNASTATSATTVTTNANLTGPITSVGNATAIASQTGTGTKFVVDTTPSITNPNIVGTATNDSAVAGSVGEYLSQTRLRSAASALTTQVVINVTATPLVLTAGDWDLSAMVGFLTGTATSAISANIAVSLTSATLPATDTTAVPAAGEVRVAQQFSAAGLTLGNAASFSITIPQYRISINTSTTFYLVAVSTFAISTLSVFGSIMARRVR